MEIHQLEYFVAVAETGSFSRAAARCNVAQPSLSQQIIKLEREISHPLFDRLGRKAVPTDAGRRLVPRALAVSDTSAQISYRPVDDLPPQRKIAAATHAKRRRSFLARHFVEMVQAEYPV